MNDHYNIIYQLIILAADQSKHMHEQMSGAAMAMPPDPKAAFKAEWEALEIADHNWALAWTEGELLPALKASQSPPDETMQFPIAAPM